MFVSEWPILAGICVVFVILGVWAIAQIFPMTTRARDKPSKGAAHPRKQSKPQKRVDQ
jgi:hypothetical protein